MSKNHIEQEKDNNKSGKVFKATVAGVAAAGGVAGVFAADAMSETEDDSHITTEQDVAEETQQVEADEMPNNTEQETEPSVSESPAETEAEEHTEMPSHTTTDSATEPASQEFDSPEEPSVQTEQIAGTEVEYTNETAPTEYDIESNDIIGQQIDVTPENNPFADGVSFTEYVDEDASQPSISTEQIVTGEEQFAEIHQTSTETYNDGIAGESINVTPENTPFADGVAFTEYVDDESQPSISTEQIVTGEEHFAEIHQTSTETYNDGIAGESINVTPENNPFADGVAFTEYVDDATISEMPDVQPELADNAITDIQEDDFFNDGTLIDKIISGDFIDPMDAMAETDAVLTYGDAIYSEDGNMVSAVEVQNEGVDMMMYDTDGDNIFDLMVDDTNRVNYDVNAWNISVGDALISATNDDMGYIPSDMETPDAFNPDMSNDLIDPSMA